MIKEKISIIGSAASIIGGVVALLTSSTAIFFVAVLLFIVVVCYVYIIEQKSPYEYCLLFNEIVVEILDEKGEEAIHKYASKIKILKNNAFYYKEAYSADGEIVNPKTNIGVIEEVKTEAGQYKYRTTLGEKRKKGEIINREFEFVALNAFQKEEEYFYHKQRHLGNVVKITIIFPLKRNPKDFWVEKHIGHYITDSQFQARPIFINKKSAIELTIPQIEINESYFIRWRW